MRQLYPHNLDDVDPAQTYLVQRCAHHDRPWVLANMVSSIDGAATSKGKSGALSSSGDRHIFHLLRTMADVILVGAGTVRTERYGPGKGVGPEAPTFAVVSRDLELDWSSPFFAEATTKPYLITCSESETKLPKDGAGLVNLVIAGTDHVDLTQAMRELGYLGEQVVLCEGGPNLLGQLVANSLVDELCLTISPQLVGNDGPRILAGAMPSEQSATLCHVLEEQGYLFLRYAVNSNP